MDDKRLDALRRRVRRAGESANCPGREQLLDALERFLVASSLDTAEDLAEAFAAWLAGRPDDWEMWISGAREDRDHLAWKIVQALVRILRDREPERLMDHPPLFDWVLDVATGLCPEPARPGGGPDERLSRIRHRAIAMTVARLASLPDGPPIWSDLVDSACHLVSARLDDRAGITRGRYKRQPDTVRKHYVKYRGKLGRARLLGTTPLSSSGGS